MLRLLAAHRAIVDSNIDLQDGRVVNTAGDDVLAEFTSPPPRAPEAEAMKKGRVRGLYLACALLAAAVSAEAEPLSIVSITAPAPNCVFHPTCQVRVTERVSNIPLPGVVGKALVESRIFSGLPETVGAGKTAYLYRVNLLQASGAVECVAGMVINFGPVMPMSYRRGVLSEVFVITSRGVGTVGLKSAEQFGDVVTFEFSKLLCVGSRPGHGVSTFFFGLTASTGPTRTTAEVFGIGSPPLVEVSVRAPAH